MQDIVIIPTYNEKDTIEYILRELHDLYPKIRIVVVDDSSPDGTGDIVKKFMSSNNLLELVVRKNKTGLGDAYKDVLESIKQDKDIRYIFTMDADGSHSPEYIKKMRIALELNDLVVGSRYVKGGGVENWEKWRLLLSHFGNIYSKFLTGVPVNDLTAGFVGMRRSLLANMNFSHLNSAGYAYQIEFKSYCFYILKAKIAEIPILFKSRRGGESKLSNQIIKEGIFTPIRILWKVIKKQY